jgi:pseudouridine-5'-phosphate glycosidase
MNNYIEISGEIKEALENKKPVVALESSVISQGLPYPANIETAFRLEDITRETGAIPATTGIINGKIKVGLSKSDIEKLATDNKVFKVSKRDIATVVAKNGSGGTTVASTCFIASMAGIKVFATGGIGGVHPDGEKTLDISADLNELNRNNIIVVSAGPKSIIDIRLTMEYLETAGVTVIGYQTDFCPHFFLTPEEKCPVSINAESPEEIARIFNVKQEIGITGGLLVVNPLKSDECLSYKEFEHAFTRAGRDAEKEKISGKLVTPYLLRKIDEYTGGKSKKANLLLLERNVRLASLIAIKIY